MSYNMPCVVNIRNISSNLTFGKQAEKDMLSVIQKSVGMVLKPSNDPYSPFDFSSPDKNSVAELKTRRGDYKQKRYATFPFDACKLEAFERMKKLNPNLEGYIFWWWPDMGVLHRWKINLDPDSIQHFASNWIVDGKQKKVIEVHIDETEQTTSKWCSHLLSQTLR